MKKCGKCKEIKPLMKFNKDKYTKTGYRSQCKDCMTEQRLEMKEYYKEWRSTPEKKAWYAEYRKARYQQNKEKSDARNSARKVTKQPCEVCGELKVDAHHDDYAKPLEVRWLCKKHHAEHHKNEREKLR